MAIFSYDFDETIASGGWPDISKAILIPEAKKAMLFTKALGHTIVIWTCREGKLLKDAINFLNENNIPWDYANENDPERVKFYNSDSRKLGCDCYIDDKNLGGIDWKELTYQIAILFCKEELAKGKSDVDIFQFVHQKYNEIYGE